jgi:RasGEF domain/RasGEF N-terminal motif
MPQKCVSGVALCVFAERAVRPVMRPPYRSHQLPPFVFPPVTPPRSASIDGYDSQSIGDALCNSLASRNYSPWTPTRRPRRSSHGTLQNSTPLFPRAKHQRAHSFSTVRGQPATQASDIGTYRIVIDRPEQRRPKTADEVPVPTLEVQIPHYRLGSPRFSPRGTAFLRNSSFTNADLRSSYLSQSDIDKLFPVPPAMMHQSLLTQRHSQISNDVLPNQPALNFNRPPTPIGPSIYDALTFPPQSDHPSVVKYSPTTGEIIAATPPRIIAQITSPSFLDYELLSDFFLTYRLFLSPSELVEYIVARLQWAVSREDEVGKVVRVRTFVAIRHWILNYFVDDFLPDYELRVMFCDLFNLLHDEVKRRPGGGGSDARIIGEAKKCWQRTCALYWDGPSSVAVDGADGNIYPGGPVGSREEQQMTFANQPDLTELDSGPPQITSIMKQGDLRGTAGTFVQDVVGDKPENTGPGKRSPEVGVGRNEHRVAARRQASESSVQAQSCSIPTRARKQADPNRAMPLAAHPVNISPATSTSSQLRSSPPAIRRQPGHSHKRSGSFSDALRDDRAPLPLPKAIFQSTQLLMAVPYAGSLVRGNIFPPTQASVEIVAPGTPVNGSRPGPPQAPSATYRMNSGGQHGAMAGSNPGMRKFFGSVRRALSARHNHYGHSIGGIGLAIFPATKLHSSEVVESPSPSNAGRAGERAAGPQGSTTRIDILGAGVVEAFKKAVEQDVGNEEHEGTVGDVAASNHESTHELDQQPETENTIRNAIPSTVTMGSKSIVIVDDTWPPPPQQPEMPGLPMQQIPANIYVPQSPKEALMPIKLQHRNPPSASVPSQRNGYAPAQRRSRSFSFERTQISSQQFEMSMGATGPSSGASAFGRSSTRFGGRSFKSSKSGSLRRYASYQSGMSRRSPSHSFDATSVSGSIMASYNHPLNPLPARMLRRRPGGDLRAVRNVTDLEQPPRPRSAGSLSEYSGSVSSSILQTTQTVQVGMAASDYSPQAPQRFSLGALAEGGNKDNTSLVETHSSQPNMRPSFEAEVAKLAQIPDDDGDGGVESALMKLEGRYEKRQSDDSFSKAGRTLSLGATTYSGNHDVGNESEEKRRHRHKKVLDNTITETPPLPEGEETPLAASLAGESGEDEADSPVLVSPTVSRGKSQLIGSDDGSYDSMPLLDRGLTDGSMQDSSPIREWSDVSVPAPLFSNNRTVYMPSTEAASSHPSMEYVEKTESMWRIHHDSIAPVNPGSHQSFLFDDSDGISDLSSELSIEVISHEEAVKQSPSARSPLGSRPIVLEGSLPFHPLRHPPSPPLTTAHAFPMTPASGSCGNNQLPPTPDPTPTLPSQGISHSQKSSGKSIFQQSQTSGVTAESIHLPFILAFDSDLLARQFTLIEKDALNEVDWRELVELKWKQTSPVVRDWVEFLNTQEPKGVEMVIARFNLMVKWAMSEIVMTRNIEERARTIVKYIHIAAHARKYQNFATMYQITIALLGIDIARLAKTWRLVPEPDLQTLRDMEALVQPVRNFHSLRVEMETAVGDGGCIPFVGIYTHDLIYNAQRPSQIASTPTTEPLVNFERHRTTAAIVKSLLRLLEASSKYTFEAVDGACERCLWIAALSDDEIRTLSRELE